MIIIRYKFRRSFAKYKEARKVYDGETVLQ
jgi:hypothetical protein